MYSRLRLISSSNLQSSCRALFSRYYSTSSTPASSDAGIDAATIPELLKKAADTYGDRDALFACGQRDRFSFKELKTQVEAAAVGLLDARMRPGDVLLSSLPNSTENTVVQLAAGVAGFVLGALPQAPTASDFETAIDDLKARGIIIPDKVDNVDYVELLLNEVFKEYRDLDVGPIPVRSLRFPSVKTLIHTGQDIPSVFLPFHDLLVYNPLPSPLPQLQKDHIRPESLVAALYFSSERAAAGLSHRAVLEGARAVRGGLGLGLGDSVGLALPANGPSGLAASAAAVAAGARQVTFPPSRLGAPAEKDERPLTEMLDILVASPSALRSALGSGATSGKIRRLVVADGPLTSWDGELAERLAQNWPGVEVQRVTYLPLVLAPLFVTDGRVSAPNLLGTPTAKTQVRVVDSKGAPLPSGRVGELQFKGPHVTLTEEDGWMPSPIQGKVVDGLYYRE